MASKPRKAFDGVGRPQGFIDDAAKALVKGVKKAVTRNKVSSATRGQMYNRARAAEKRLSEGTYPKISDLNIDGLLKAKRADAADVAAFMAKKKRGRR